MKIGLINLDTSKRRRPFPNLALMKLSAYHKMIGDEVFMNFPLIGADKTYASCVFSWNKTRTASVPHGAEVGGSGVDLKKALPAPVEKMMPDYGLYPGLDFSLGFITRGCSRRCPWCIVPEKEGRIRKAANLNDFWDHRHKKVKLLDNNILAAPEWADIYAELLDAGAEVDFNQGLDIRLLDEEKAEQIAKLNVKQYRFAFDAISEEKAVRKGIALMQGAGVRTRKLSFYVLAGYRVDDALLERMEILSGLNVDVYPMLYRGPDGRPPARRMIFNGNSMWHGNRNVIRGFLRTVGRLPE